MTPATALNLALQEAPSNEDASPVDGPSADGPSVDGNRSGCPLWRVAEASPECHMPGIPRERAATGRVRALESGAGRAGLRRIDAGRLLRFEPGGSSGAR